MKTYPLLLTFVQRWLRPSLSGRIAEILQEGFTPYSTTELLHAKTCLVTMYDAGGPFFSDNLRCEVMGLQMDIGVELSRRTQKIREQVRPDYYVLLREDARAKEREAPHNLVSLGMWKEPLRVLEVREDQLVVKRSPCTTEAGKIHPGRTYVVEMVYVDSMSEG
jgi:hypothetical protein